MNTRLKTLALRSTLEAIAFSRLDQLFPSIRGRGVIFTLHHVRPKTHHEFDPNLHLEITPEFLDLAIGGIALREQHCKTVKQPLRRLARLNPRNVADAVVTRRQIGALVNRGLKFDRSLAQRNDGITLLRRE